VVGHCRRPGQQEVTIACAALDTFRAELGRLVVSVEADPDDPEQTLLKSRLVHHVQTDSPPDLMELTRIAHEVIADDLQHLIDLTIDTTEADYAVLTGIQIHEPRNEGRIWPGRTYACVDGNRMDLDW
jgi:hypothetical protein